MLPRWHSLDLPSLFCHRPLFINACQIPLISSSCVKHTADTITHQFILCQISLLLSVHFIRLRHGSQRPKIIVRRYSFYTSDDNGTSHKVHASERWPRHVTDSSACPHDNEPYLRCLGQYPPERDRHHNVICLMSESV